MHKKAWDTTANNEVYIYKLKLIHTKVMKISLQIWLIFDRALPDFFSFSQNCNYHSDSKLSTFKTIQHASISRLTSVGHDIYIYAFGARNDGVGVTGSLLHFLRIRKQDE